MPTLSLFNGIVIRMNKEDGGRHHTPHIHASHDEHEASYDIETCERLAGELTMDDEYRVKAWITLHRDDLRANWKLLIEEGKYFKIDPLR